MIGCAEMSTNFKQESREIKLDLRSKKLRNLVLDALSGGGRGHLGPAFSLIEIVRVLYDSVLIQDPKNPDLANRDRFILSKGHGCLGLYAVLSDFGYFPKEKLNDFCGFESILGGHPESTTIPGVEFSTGSLGHGLPFAVGTAMAARLRKEHWRTYVLVGDGELNEGSIWESAMHANQHKLGALTVIVDFNGLQASGPIDSVVTLAPLTKKWESFGFKVYEVNGHDIQALEKVLVMPFNDIGQPIAILAHTVKGKGLISAENSNDWHHKAKIAVEEIEAFREELEQR